MRKLIILLVVVTLATSACFKEDPAEAGTTPTTTTVPETTSTTTTTLPPTTTTTVPETTTTTVPEPEGCYAGMGRYFEIGLIEEGTLTGYTGNGVSNTEALCVQLVNKLTMELGPGDHPSGLIDVVVRRGEDGDEVVRFLLNLMEVDQHVMIVSIPVHPAYVEVSGGFTAGDWNVPTDKLMDYLEVGEYYFVELIMSNGYVWDREETYYRINSAAIPYNVELVSALRTGAPIPKPEEGAGAALIPILLGTTVDAIAGG